MRKNQIEAWAIGAIERARAGSVHVEDSFVEFKSELITPEKAARQIAALANSARGSDALWVVGCDEKAVCATVPTADLGNWEEAYRSAFDEEVVPNLTAVSVHLDGVDVLALHIETDRAPYVVKNPSGGPISREVPVRRLARTDSAHRSDLLRMLAPQLHLPDIEVVWAKMAPAPPGEGFQMPLSESAAEMFLSIALYVTPRGPGLLALPNRKISVRAVAGPGGEDVKFVRPALDAYKLRHTKTGAVVEDDRVLTSGIEYSAIQVVVSGPGMMVLQAATAYELVKECESVDVAFQIQPAGVDGEITGRVVLLKRSDLPYFASLTSNEVETGRLTTVGKK